MKIRLLAIGTLTIFLAACGSGGGGNTDNGTETIGVDAEQDAWTPGDTGPEDAGTDRPGADADDLGPDGPADGDTSDIAEDEGLPPCQTYYLDKDGDGYGVDDFKCLQDPETPYSATQAGDCDDTSKFVHPGREEDCETDHDDDCNGETNEQDALFCTPFFADVDEDGFYPEGADSQCWCQSVVGFTGETPGDCDDTNADVNPEGYEQCNGIDDDCDGDTDGDLCPEFTYYCDKDGDQHASSAIDGTCDWFECMPEGCSTQAGDDCDDSKSDVNPSMGEVCNGLDDNCAGGVDEGDVCPVVDYYCDSDADLFLSSSPSGSCAAFDCVPDDCSAVQGDDCNDKNEAVSPSTTEICNGVDDNCVGGADEGGVCPVLDFYCDDDADGHASATITGTCGSFECVPDGCNLDPGDDCNDNEFGINPGAAEVCNGIDDDCAGGADDGACPEVPFHCDKDEDGYLSSTPSGTCAAFECVPEGCSKAQGDDCNDNMKEVNPGAVESCNGKDDDCTGEADDGDACPQTSYFCDLDGDGHVSMVVSGSCDSFECVPADCQMTAGDDCDDHAYVIAPGATEACNGIDDDCDSDTDEDGACGQTSFYCDVDGDGFLSDAVSGTCQAFGCVPPDCSTDPGTDCNDNRFEVNPDATEVCSTPYDDDCDGSANDQDGTGCTEYWYDEDLDGYYAAGAATQCRCGPGEGYGGLLEGDCDDTDADVNAGAVEVCNAKDDDCDGGTDEDDICGQTVYYCDGDQDGHDSATASGTCSTADCVPADCRTVAGDDCDDAVFEVNPDATEDCVTAFDDDCDGAANDEGALNCTVFYRDFDGDGFGLADDSRCLCQAVHPYDSDPASATDCNDNNLNVHPGADEVCNGMDDDCNGQTDESFVCPFITYYCDKDEDGHPSDFLSGVCSSFNCAPAGCGEVKGDDCNDNEPSIHGGADETCNGVDDNCAAGVDEGEVCPPVPYRCDLDGDGFVSNLPSGTCYSFDCIPADCQAEPGPDCNDNDDAVSPAATETCDGTDENCSGEADEGGVCPVVPYHCDQDGDLHVSEAVTGTCQAFMCIPLGCTGSPGDDCNDNKPSIFPGSAETCNGIDDDCDGGVDEDGICPPVPFYCDNDTDQYVSSAESGTCQAFMCIPAACQGAAGPDCNDNDPEINPAASESCNGIDDDCSGVTDGPSVCPLVEYYCDVDTDQYISDSISGSCQIWQCLPPDCTDTPGPDCNDADPAVHPGGFEQCNGADDNCSGTPDDDTCTIDATCWESMQPNPDNPCIKCDPTADPTAWSDFNDTPCDDGYAATLDDTCSNGACVGTLAHCFDTLTFDDSLRIQSLLVGDDGNPGQGLDIDGNPDTCMPAGTYSDGSPICSEGIDNKMALTDILINTELTKALDEGGIQILMELVDWTADGNPFVLAMHQARLDPTNPDCDFTLPGCVFEVQLRRFDAQCNEEVHIDNATIVGDHLTAGGPDHEIALSIPLIGDMVVSVGLKMAQVVGTVTFTGQKITAFSGIIGGAVNRDQLIAAIEATPDASLPMPKDQIIGLVNLLLAPDIDVDGDGTAESISIGLLVEADEAAISGLYW